MGLRDAMNDALEAQSPKIVGHLRGGIRSPEQGFDLRPEIPVAESARQMREAGDRLEQRHHTRIAEAEGGHALALFDGRALEPVKGVLREDAVMTDALDFEEPAIDLVAQFAEEREIVHALVDVEVLRIVDRRFGPERVLLFE